MSKTAYVRVNEYARAVVKGNKPAGQFVKDACKRHLDDLEKGKERGIYFDKKAAQHTFDFFEEILKLSGGKFEGEPFVLLDWQAFIIGNLFGWKRTKDNKRRFRMAFVETGKGSGKSPLSGGIGLYMMFGDGEARAEIYAAASKRDQAMILFRDAVSMVDQSPELNKRADMSGGINKNNIAWIEKGSFFRPISTENSGKGQSGVRPHCVLLDEIHEHPTNAMVEFMRAGTKGREQALIFMITNSGSDMKSVCYDYHKYGTEVNARTIEDDSFFSYICSVDDKDDPLNDETCWAKANPSLGQTFTHEYLREQVTQARNLPSKQNLVLRLNFCVWTDAENAWIGKNAWMDVENEEIKYTGGRIWCGLDLSAKKDLTAFAYVWELDNGKIAAEVMFWTPGNTLKDRELTDRAPYLTWKRQGYLNAIQSNTIDYGHVLKDIISVLDNETVAFGFDRWKMDLFKNECAEYGITEKTMNFVDMGQGFKDMNACVEALEKNILDKNIQIKLNPVLRWNAASAMLSTDPAGNRKFDKQKVTGRIDGIVALAMAVGLYEQFKNDRKKASVYENRGLISI